MIVTQTEVLSIPVAEATIMVNRETPAYPRALTFRNLTASSTIQYKVQSSSDGGATWSDLTLANGSTIQPLTPGAITVERFTTLNIIRVRASGGGNDRDLLFSLIRMYVAVTQVWTSPLL